MQCSTELEGNKNFSGSIKLNILCTTFLMLELRTVSSPYYNGAIVATTLRDAEGYTNQPVVLV